MNKAFKKAKFIIANSKYTKDLGLRWVRKKKIHIIHPGQLSIKIEKDRIKSKRNIWSAFPKLLLLQD